MGLAHDCKTKGISIRYSLNKNNIVELSFLGSLQDLL